MSDENQRLETSGLARIGRRFSLAGRVALVTGGSMSIGRAIATGLAEAGADVAIQSSPRADAGLGLPQAALETQAAILALGRRCAVVEADFAEPGAAGRTVQAAAAALGRVDILVVCASVQTRQVLEAITDDELQRQVGINFAATVALLQAAVPAMAARGWGRVLSIGSVNETRPDPALGVYAALKAAQHNLIDNLARQYAPQGVMLNTLSPGLVATERNRWRRQDAAAWARIEAEINPLGRAARPEEMVGAALLLCSDAASFITGADVQVTGGGHLR
jgi:NAD(P)-dependent dehydrogenase (short-subunit alcohol dehydrogenase family)